MRNSPKGVVLVCIAAMIAALSSALLVLLPTASAGAATYPPTTCATISVSTTTPRVGQSITVTGEQFRAGTSVKIYLTPAGDYTAGAAPAASSVLLASVTADANGSFSAQVTMPSGATGNQVISAAGVGKVCPADPIQLQVSGGGAGGGGTTTSSSGGGPTANTGTAIALLIGVALALLATGLLFARGGKRRHVSSRR